MNKPTSFITSLLIICLLLHSVAAQSLSIEQATSPTAKVTIYRDLVRFAAVDAEQLRLELFDLSGNKIFDSGFVSGNSFDWLTQNQQGQPVDSSLFAYTLTVQGKGRAESLIQQGNVIIDRERQNLPDAPEIPGKRKRGEIQPQTANVFDVSATGGSYNIDTPLMGIGNSNPRARLHVGAGIDPPLTTGSTLLVEEGAASSVVIKGTAGGEMLLSQDNAAGVFGTVSPHPLSIRTSNANRIYIDAIGRVGIGTTTPTATLTVAGTIEASGGTLTGAAINTSTQYNINGNRVLGIAGNHSLFAGLGAGVSITSGTSNSFYGSSAGNSNTSGSNNSFYGSLAGNLNTSGNGNAFFGDSAGRSNTIGGHNSFFGSGAGAANTTANFNSFFGRDAGGRNTTGNENAFFGVSTGLDNTTGSRNAFFGRGAGRTNTTGSENAFFGKDAGYLNTTGSENAFFGKNAGFTNSTGYENSFFGESAGYLNTTGYENAFFGESAGFANSTGSANAMFGASAGALNTTGVNNAFFGASAGGRNTTGTHNTFAGRNAGLNNTTASYNSFFGYSAGQENTTGHSNSFTGVGAGYSNATGSRNAFFGYSAGYANLSGHFNSFFGQSAGSSNTTGSGNIFLGSWAGSSNTIGGTNVFVGASAGSLNLSGEGNAAFGTSAGYNNTTGSYNTFLGDSANASTSNLSNVTAIGARAFVSQNNSIVLGSINGVNGATADTRVAIGTTAPGSKVHIIDSGNTGLRVQTNTPGGMVATFGRYGDFRIDTSSDSGGRFTVTEAGNVGIGINTPASKLHVIGNATITGNLSKGGGSFKIDHPLDPENKYLYHSFVESPDMMNIYNGNVTTDKRGLAIVTLPDYFEALNRDFRYQLTVIGQFAQAIVAREVKDKQFTIKTSTPNVKVSWQVTGIRQDAYANKHRIPVEEEKKGNERGTYLYPEAFDKSAPRIARQVTKSSQQRSRAKN
jgi:hypothetical protein